jgi:hypothetical protein
MTNFNSCYVIWGRLAKNLMLANTGPQLAVPFL